MLCLVFKNKKSPILLLGEFIVSIFKDAAGLTCNALFSNLILSLVQQILLCNNQYYLKYSLFFLLPIYLYNLYQGSILLTIGCHLLCNFYHFFGLITYNKHKLHLTLVVCHSSKISLTFSNFSSDNLCQENCLNFKHNSLCNCLFSQSSLLK